MAKQFYRVPTAWDIVIEPRATPLYLLNITGATIEFALTTTTDYLEEILHPYTVGGVISQIYVPADTYVVARCQKHGDTAILTADTTRIQSLTDTITREDVDAVVVEMMRIESRLRQEELRSAYRDNAELLQNREINDAFMKTQLIDAKQNTALINMRMQLFAAESYIRTHMRDFAAIETTVTELAKHEGVSQEVEAVQLKILTMDTSITTIIGKLNELNAKVSAVWGDYEQIVTGAVGPLQTELTTLKDNVDSFNNALVNMASKNSKEAIIAAFDEFIMSADEEMQGPLTALKDVLVKLSETIQANAEQDTLIAQKVDMTDTLLIEAPELTTLLGE